MEKGVFLKASNHPSPIQQGGGRGAPPRWKGSVVVL
jgi:hypothetical protein